MAASSITCRETARLLIFTWSDLAWRMATAVATSRLREQNLRVTKPWKCRLGLHDWEVRENPETHAHYEVCLRCDTDRDTRRPSWSPDSGDTEQLGKPGNQ